MSETVNNPLTNLHMRTVSRSLAQYSYRSKFIPARYLIQYTEHENPPPVRITVIVQKNILEILEKLWCRCQQDCRTSCLTTSKSKVTRDDTRRRRGSQGRSPRESSGGITGHHHARTPCLADPVAGRAREGSGGKAEYGGEENG